MARWVFTFYCVTCVYRCRSIHATEISQESVVEQARAGVSPKYTSDDVEIEYGICKRDPYFEILEKALKIDMNPELFRYFFALLGAQ